MGRWIRGRRSGWPSRHRNRLQPLQYRHAVRLRAGLHRGHDPALPRARAASRLPRPPWSNLPGAQRYLLHRADDGAGSADVDSLLHLALHRPADLLLLQPPPVRIRGALTGWRSRPFLVVRLPGLVIATVYRFRLGRALLSEI